VIENMTDALDFHSKALVLRAEKQRIIAGNIANADTPGYVATDLDFKSAMRRVTGNSALSSSNNKHIHMPSVSLGEMDRAGARVYASQSQPSLDKNSVDLDRERANFTDNSVRYEATLRFINSQSKTLLSAIQGQ